MENLPVDDKWKFLAEFNVSKEINAVIDGESFTFKEDIVKFEKVEEKITEAKFIPSVIEPAFGIGRVVYCIFEHCFRIREKDEKRTFFAFPPVVAPVKVSILPLINDDSINNYIEPISKYLLF